MAKLRIRGDTSGYVDIAAPAVAGTTTVNLDKIPQTDQTVNFTSNVGIGTSSFPANGKNLKIEDATISRVILANTSHSTFEFGSVSGGALNVYDATADVERMRIDAGGRVTMPFQPCAYVDYGSRSVSAGAVSIFTGGTVEVNVGNIYNSTNGRYTAPVAGVYRLTMGSQGKTSSNGSAGSLYYAVNGTEFFGQTLFYGEAYSGSSSQFLISLSANDYVRVHSFGNNSVSYTHNGVRATFELVS